ncbi:hypothetical protein ZIOFF_010057 [Zingiber officinale]|uniref:Uncharacterized protein n=1 Tax=Zingiber officinale TaxID=94328 RepID=A0A8J5HUV9_ZINOF|nr:hypothetical protein ZIOFF_010057 [Zingiber officinale]
MGVHLLIIGKFKLLGGGHGSCQLLASLFCPFALKLPFFAAGRLPNSCSALAVSIRFFLFRLGHVSTRRRFHRWERSIRFLLRDRAVVGNDRRRRVLSPSDEMLTAISMLTL